MVCFSRRLPPDVKVPKSNFQGNFLSVSLSTKVIITAQVPLTVWQILLQVLSFSFKALRGRFKYNSKYPQMNIGLNYIMPLITLAYSSNIS